MLYDISWVNAVLLSASIPSFKKDKEKEEKIEAISTKEASVFFGMN